MSDTTGKEAAAVVDGLHASEGVEYLARLEGFDGDELPGAVVLERGFSEPTAFFRESKGRGFWMTTLNECSCPSYRYRGAGCKHQRKLAALLRDRAPHLPAGVVGMTSEELEARADRIAARNARLREERAELAAGATNPDRRGFNLPEEAEA